MDETLHLAEVIAMGLSLVPVIGIVKRVCEMRHLSISKTVLRFPCSVKVKLAVSLFTSLTLLSAGILGFFDGVNWLDYTLLAIYFGISFIGWSMVIYMFFLMHWTGLKKRETESN